MRKKHLFWLLLPSYWILTAIAIVAVSMYSFHSMTDLHFQSMESDLTTRAIMLSEQLPRTSNALDITDENRLCKRLGDASGTRFTIIDPHGIVLGDSHHAHTNMELHNNRPEIRAVFEGETGSDLRYSRTARKETMYVAVPVKDDNGKIICAVRAALPMTLIEERLNRMLVRVLAAALLTGILAMLLCIFLVRRITTPLLNMSRAASHFAEGDFSHRIPAQQTLELDQLASSLNAMSTRLNRTLSTLNEQRNEQRAVLTSMDEAVLAVNRREQIIHMNRAAGELLDIDPEASKREWLQQVIRYSNLQEFIKAVLGTQKPVSRDLVLMGESERQIQARGSVLQDDEGEPIGALIILRDVTQLRHLETVRSDFVANVSHELKTPITSIKGFVETLLSDDWNHTPEIIRFLDIIQQQAGRLDAIIDDLLTLSRLEQKQGEVLTETANLHEVLANAVQLCELQANDKNIRIEIDCPDDLILDINAPLLEQSLVNLIVNAIKYSEPSKAVLVKAGRISRHIQIHVHDQGFGIEKKHQERLFERFYRVDTARSRKLGGTGLGLSIVKHIVSVHGGTISVDSRLGEGSTFTITLPAQEAE